MSRLVTFLKNAVRQIISSRAYLWASRLTDVVVLRFIPRRNRTDERYAAVVIATAGRGNIGDQAMLNAVLLNTAGRIAVVLNSVGSLRIPETVRPRVDVVVLPSLVMGAPIARVRARRTFFQLLHRSEGLLIIGADILDGSYDRREAVLRFHLARIAEKLGITTRFLGFSWSESPDEEVLKEARRPNSTRTLLVRDPRSAARMRAYGIDVEEVADVAFTLAASPSLPQDVDSWLHDAGATRPLVIFNTSGLLASRYVGIRQSYVAIAEGLLEAGCRVLVLPHVLRKGDDDLAESHRLFAELGERDDVLLVERLLTPEEVGCVAKYASAVVTGRMHLAILAMNAGTPAAIMSSQGKVTGLLELAGLGELELTPDAELAANALNAVHQILHDERTRSRLGASLPAIRALSAKNFAQ